jgi:hypothetical protein
VIRARTHPHTDHCVVARGIVQGSRSVTDGVKRQCFTAWVQYQMFCGVIKRVDRDSRCALWSLGGNQRQCGAKPNLPAGLLSPNHTPFTFHRLVERQLRMKPSVVCALLGAASGLCSPAQEPLQSEAKKHVLTHDLMGFHKNITSIESITGNEKAVGEWLAHSLESQGYTVEKQVVEEKPLRFNIVAWPGKKAKDTQVLVSSHIDTVSTQSSIISLSYRRTLIQRVSSCQARMKSGHACNNAASSERLNPVPSSNCTPHLSWQGYPRRIK